MVTFVLHNSIFKAPKVKSNVKSDEFSDSLLYHQRVYVACVNCTWRVVIWALRAFLWNPIDNSDLLLLFFALLWMFYFCVIVCLYNIEPFLDLNRCDMKSRLDSKISSNNIIVWNVADKTLKEDFINRNMSDGSEKSLFTVSRDVAWVDKNYEQRKSLQIAFTMFQKSDMLKFVLWKYF